MRVVTVLGSPRRRGNTATVLAWSEQAWREAGHEVERYDIVDYIVRGCTGCYACQRPSAVPSCAQDDDANLILGAMAQADLIVLASPVYCWGVSAQLKALLDRSIALTHNYEGGSEYLLTDRRVALLATAGGGIEGNAELMLPPFERWVGYHQAINAGHLLVPACTEPEALSDDLAGAAHAFATAVLSAAPALGA
ncbi:MAG: flavodoxin family protein [Armatimonadetes bacterium]|nr:flavodoxin family protein [Armatimonadota bacterium]